MSDQRVSSDSKEVCLNLNQRTENWVILEHTTILHKTYSKT